MASMSEFREFIITSLQISDAKMVSEIGTESGGMSALLAQWLKPRGGSLSCIDPSPRSEFLAWLSTTNGVSHIAQASLDALKELPCPDAWLVDGDHNWYTVFHELEQIFRSFYDANKHPLIFAHDVGWPCARRDMYYAPERIPQEFRNRYTYNAGVTLDHSRLMPNRGIRGGNEFAYADEEGGPRNGVLTAVEDALALQKRAGHALAFVRIPAVFGLGVIFDPNAPWSDSLASYLLPFHENPLIGRLERNRLANFLCVLDVVDTSRPT